jgi:hypothetical protein
MMNTTWKGGASLLGSLVICGALAGCGGTSEAPGAMPLLVTHPGCPLTLFADGTLPQDLSTQAAYGAAWTGGWVQPQIKNGALAFGPHPMTANWWENYSPTASKQKPGDVLLCTKLRMTPEAGGAASDNSFELTMRLPDGAGFETAGMTLDLEVNGGVARLRTRTGDNQWTTYESKPIAGEPGAEITYELLLFGQGNRFLAEVRNTKTGQVVILHASATFPAGGAVTMLGWRNRYGAYVDRLVMGQPSLNIAGTLASELNP